METDQERWSLFVEGVGLVFRSWTALQMAVENGWGGSRSADKAEEMIEDTLYWFTLTKNDPDIYALQDQLLAAMLEDFNTQIEDGSLGEVAGKMITLFHQCRRGDVTALDQLRANVSALPTSRMAPENQNQSESSSDSEEETVDVIHQQTRSKPAPEIDSDGFTVVTRRRGR